MVSRSIRPEAVRHRPNRPSRIGLRLGADRRVRIRGQGRVQHVLRNRLRLVHVEEAVLDAAVDVGVDREARARPELALESDAARPGVLVLEVGRDLLDVARRQHRARRERRQRVRERREQRVGRRQRHRHLAVAAADAALDDGEDRILLREASDATADGPFLIALRVPREPDARIEVVLVGPRRPVGNVLDDLDVVAQAEVERQVVADAPVVLQERRRSRTPSGTSARLPAPARTTAETGTAWAPRPGTPVKR